MAVMAGSMVETRYAGFWTRFVAALIDGVIIGIVSGVLTAALHSLGSGLGVVIFLGYYAYFESSERQATPGKMVMHIKATDLDGNRLTFGRALGRNAAKYISAAILFIGYIMAAFTAKKQALHDMIASTLVVHDQ